MSIAYWVIGQVNHKTVFTGPYRSESEGLTKARNIQDWDNDNFDCKMYPTLDMARAKSMYKASLADSTGRMGNAFMRIGSGEKTNTRMKHSSRLDKIKAERGIE
jgi:hypothetical protein